MKKIAHVLLGLLFLFACEEDQASVPSCSAEIDEFLINNYSEDAKHLLFSEIISNTQHPDRNQPKFSQQGLDSILRAIQSVYNLEIPERDSVFEIYDIHVRPVYSLRSISLKVNPDAEEIKNLVAGITPTGNNNLDLIIEKYHFSEVWKTYSYPQSPSISITSTESYNLLPIVNDLKAIPSIIHAEQDKFLYFLMIQENPDIKYSKRDDKKILDFSVTKIAGEEDCWPRCVYRKHWIFEIDNNCQALFKESFIE